MDYPVEQGVPIPPARIKTNKYPWKTLQVGESFFIPNGTLRNPFNLHSAANRRRIKISIRQVDGGVRVWRVG